MLDATGILIVPNDVAGVVDAVGKGGNRQRIVKGGVDTVTEDKAV